MTNAENGQRDELARDLFIADNSNQPREASLVDWGWFEARGNQRGQIEHYKNMAAGMIAAGYRKPRTITTVEELEALRDGAILRCGGVTYEHHDGWFHGVDGSNITAELISLPAVILWEEVSA